MKQKEKVSTLYVPPEVGVLQVMVERGFSGSGTWTPPPSSGGGGSTTTSPSAGGDIGTWSDGDEGFWE